MKKLVILLTITCITLAPTAFAQDWQPAGDTWIEKWWGLDLVLNTGGFAASADHDYLAEGTMDESTGRPVITNSSVSTREGAGLTGNLPVILPPNNGGALNWRVVTINTNNDSYNLSTSHGVQGHLDNITWHGIILILSPDDRTTTMHPAHDDHAEIWINGVQVYDNPTWTSGANNATHPTEVDLVKGENFLHFKCGEGGGGDYLNLRFEESDADLKIAPTLDGRFLDILTPVEPKGKLATRWADIKRK